MRFSIHTDRDSPDERTRLNLGIEESTDFSVDPNDFDPLFRQHENGFWGTWTKPPPLSVIHVVKAENWSAERAPYGNVQSFCLLSETEIEASLQRSDTTRLIGKAEQEHLSSNDRGISAEEFSPSWNFMLPSSTTRTRFYVPSNYYECRYPSMCQRALPVASPLR